MANVATRNALYRRPGEIVYGTIVDGTIVNGDFDLLLEPGLWSVSLLVNANAVSAGTIQASLLNGDGDPLSEESLIGFIAATATGVTAAYTASLIDLVGVISLGVHAGTAVNTGIYGIPVFGSIRFTIASIAGAGTGNRIDYVATRLG